jgi:hypothetical protein
MLCAATPVTAQAIERPSRPYRGLFGGGQPPDANRTHQELVLSGSLLAGYDDMLTPSGPSTGPMQPGQPAVNGYTGTADADLRYYIGRAERSLSVTGRAYSTAYSVPGARRAVGGGLDASAVSPMGRRHRISASQGFSYAPNLVLGTFGALQPDVGETVLPDSGERSGVAGQRSVSTVSNVSFSRQWTSRQAMTGGYSYTRHIYLDDLGYDDSTHSADAGYSWAFSRSGSLQASYQVSAAQYTDREFGPGGDRPPLTNHGIELGGSYTRLVSRTRQLQLSGGGGSTYVEALLSDGGRTNYWTPSGHAALRVDLGRSWALSAHYRRAVTVLQGVTLESFATDSASLGAGGILGHRIESTFSFAYSNGQAGSGDQPGRFVNYGWSTQLRYALARCCAASLNYNYSYYRLRDIAHLPVGLPAQSGGSGVRVGFSVWLPLYGSYGGRDASRPRRGEAQ